ncbi:MAG: CCA tRNA nucleotidyltransferase [Chloroflexi bacterium]|nr:CCA tRNA nucleotidyltransferase [Chloroflexota bacterium]
MGQPEETNLAIAQRLPPALAPLLKAAGEAAAELKLSLYLVGGALRDILLHRPVVDVDLVVEGDAILVAQRMKDSLGGEVTVHSRFGTAKYRRGSLSMDIATARKESYAHPGALPTVSRGTLLEDLARRDFTINAMAAPLSLPHLGLVIDPFSGQSDITRRLIRILHPKSFVDDATRILRALRYEQRLAFHLEDETETFLRRDVGMLSTISGDRIRREMELVLTEEEPELALQRAQELGVLQSIHPHLSGNGWLREKFSQARKETPRNLLASVYLALWLYGMNKNDMETLLRRLKLSGRRATSIVDLQTLRAKRTELSNPYLLPSALCRLLDPLHPAAVAAAIVACDDPIARLNLQKYLRQLRHLRPALNGEALREIGVPPGPIMGQILQGLRQARLDGEVHTREEEEALVCHLLAERTS